MIIKSVLRDILLNKIILSYFIILSIIGWGCFIFEDNFEKGLLTLLNVILFIAPLFVVIFTSIYVYNNSKFIELLLTQPIERKKIWSSLFLSSAVSPSIAYVLGIGIPILVYAPIDISLLMISMGVGITFIFTSIAFLISSIMDDKSKGIGLSIFIWIFMTIIYDSFILFIIFQYQDYPIEKYVMALSSLNPIDLARIQIILKIDESAIMGYTGAVFKEFVGNIWGIFITTILMIIWIIIPYFISQRIFIKKDI